MREPRNTKMLIDVWNNYISPRDIPVFNNGRYIGGAVMTTTVFTVTVKTSPQSFLHLKGSKLHLVL